MRVKMLKTRNWTPPEERRITVKYREKQEYSVKREWGEALVSAGDAREVGAPKRVDPLDHDADGRKGGVAPQVD